MKRYAWTACNPFDVLKVVRYLLEYPAGFCICILGLSNTLLLLSLQEMLRILRMQGGENTSPALSLLLRFSLWFARDPFATGVRRLKALNMDLGSAFDSDVHVSARCGTWKQACGITLCRFYISN